MMVGRAVGWATFLSIVENDAKTLWFFKVWPVISGWPLSILLATRNAIILMDALRTEMIIYYNVKKRKFLFVRKMYIFFLFVCSFVFVEENVIHDMHERVKCNALLLCQCHLFCYPFLAWPVIFHGIARFRDGGLMALQ